MEVTITQVLNGYTVSVWGKKDEEGTLIAQTLEEALSEARNLLEEAENALS